jgi:hypothetical protein
MFVYLIFVWFFFVKASEVEKAELILETTKQNLESTQ